MDDKTRNLKIDSALYNVSWDSDRMVYSFNRDMLGPVVLSRDDTPPVLMNQYSSSFKHCHLFYEIEYVISGSGVQEINGVSFPVKKGDVIFLKPNETHTYYPDPHVEQFYILNCEFRQIPAGQEEKFNALPTVLPVSAKTAVEIDSIFNKMEKEFLNHEAGYEDFLNAYLNLILATLYRESGRKADEKGSLDANILAVMDFIESRHMRVTMKDCAHFLSYTSSYFSRIFKEAVGMTLTDYLNSRKFQIAMTLLSETDLSIDVVMEKSGFDHRKTFYLLFKKNLEMTPGEYRKLSKNNL